MDIDPGPGLLGDVSDGGAATADDGAHHVAGYEDPQGEVNSSGAGPGLVGVSRTFCNVRTLT